METARSAVTKPMVRTSRDSQRADPCPQEAPADAKHFETRAHIAAVDDRGILRARVKSGAEIDLEEAQDFMRLAASSSGGARQPILIDLADMRSISREARKYFAGVEAAKVQTAVAILVGSPLTRAIGNFFMGFDKTLAPTRLFGSEAEALEWLQGFLP